MRIFRLTLLLQYPNSFFTDFMQRLFTAIQLLALSFFISSTLFAQNPSGKLYLSGQNGADLHFGYVEYPAATVFNALAALRPTDIAGYEDEILLADSVIRRFNRITDQPLTDIQNTDAYQLEVWQNWLVVASYTPPYLRTYDLDNNFAPGFTLDTTHISLPPNDLLVYGNRAYVLHDSAVTVVDLPAQDTLAHVPAGVYLSWGGAHRHLAPFRGAVYIETEYFTAVPRVSFGRVDTASLTFQYTNPINIAVSFQPPIPTPDYIYVAQFANRFDPAVDSVVWTTTTWSGRAAIEWNDASNSLFLSNTDTAHVRYMRPDSSFSTPTALPFFWQGYANGNQA
ncbi:MAG: hypothetical protein AAF570_09635, partial [Bacteroidota bacterium]